MGITLDHILATIFCLPDYLTRQRISRELLLAKILGISIQLIALQRR